MNWLSLISTVVTLVFAGFVLYRYAYRGGAHLLLWGMGLVLYAIGTFAEFYLALRWSAAWFHLWYLGGAMLTAAWLGQGTVYLLVRKPAWLPHALMALLALGSVYAVWRVGGDVGQGGHCGQPVSGFEESDRGPAPRRPTPSRGVRPEGPHPPDGGG